MAYNSKEKEMSKWTKLVASDQTTYPQPLTFKQENKWDLWFEGDNFIYFADGEAFIGKMYGSFDLGGEAHVRIQSQDEWTYELEDVDAWMPLPQPYMESEQ